MEKLVVDEKWIREIHNETDDGKCNLTFCGALEKLYRYISYGWHSERTRKGNAASYNNIILPALPNHDQMRISDYTFEDYESTINRIRDKGYEKQGINYRYLESTIKGFENLIYLVVHQASVFGYCENVLWGTRYEIEVPIAENIIEEKVRLKKSFTIKQEKELYDYLFSADVLTGPQVGVLLMYALGVRNGEACGINYGDIKELDYFPDDKVVWIYKSVIPKTAILQTSGKTWNSGRIIPIPTKVYNLLVERKKEIKKVIDAKGLQDEISIKSIPVVCKGYYAESDNFCKRASAQDITNAAREIFRAIGIGSRQLAYIEREISENQLEQVVNEKEATAYLLRRNYATTLLTLGLTTAEIQYLIGHDVEDAYEVRNEFVDDDRLHCMAEKLKARMLLNDIDDEEEKYNIYLREGDEVRIYIKGKEPMDKISVKIEGKKYDDGISLHYYSDNYTRDYDRTIDVIKEYHRLYK